MKKSRGIISFITVFAIIASLFTNVVLAASTIVIYGNINVYQDSYAAASMTGAVS